jgi:plasmid stabilization system protein ParE
MRIVWLKEAIDRLADLELFIAQDSPTRAREFRNYLKDKSSVIAQNPYIGRNVPEFADPKIRELLVKNYRIVYRIAEERIEMLMVIEGHQLLKTDGLD